MSSNQHGFRNAYSMDTTLIQSYNEVTKLLGKGAPVDVIHSDIIEWIVDFLGERTRRVAVTNVKGVRVLSLPTPVLSGIPQRTVLGPSCFSIYINDAPEILQNLLTLSADDSKLIGAASSWAEAASFQANRDKLDDWARQWLLEFNSSKSKV